MVPKARVRKCGVNAPATPVPNRLASLAFVGLLAGGCAIAFAPILVRLSDTGPVAMAFAQPAQ